MRMGNSSAHSHSALHGKGAGLPANGLVVEGKVISVNPEDSTVDVALYGGQILRRVRILFNSANTVAGYKYLASIENTDSAQSTQNGVVDKAVLTHRADTLATIVYVQGQTLAPRVIGFSFPIDAQMHVNEIGLALFRHESGIYSLIDKSGHHETHYPDGSYVIASSEVDPIPKELISEGQSWQVPSGNDINIKIHLAQGVDVVIANGEISISATSIKLNGGTKGVARIGDQVTVNVGGTNYTGTITQGSTDLLID
jgi:hypothetical protein